MFYSYELFQYGGLEQLTDSVLLLNTVFPTGQALENYDRVSNEERWFLCSIYFRITTASLDSTGKMQCTSALEWLFSQSCSSRQSGQRRRGSWSRQPPACTSLHKLHTSLGQLRPESLRSLAGVWGVLGALPTVPEVFIGLNFSVSILKSCNGETYSEIMIIW